tara:strand:- start:3936 stop:4235 length:300 start_codon:yes stop_codon:yes gene_type:complete
MRPVRVTLYLYHSTIGDFIILVISVDYAFGAQAVDNLTAFFPFDEPHGATPLGHLGSRALAGIDARFPSSVLSFFAFLLSLSVGLIVVVSATAFLGVDF